MATATIETRIANPARKGKKKMARKMSAKQLKYFGTKRQKAAARASRKRKPKAAHRARTKPNGSRQRRARKEHAAFGTEKSASTRAVRASREARGGSDGHGYKKYKKNP